MPVILYMDALIFAPICAVWLWLCFTPFFFRLKTLLQLLATFLQSFVIQMLLGGSSLLGRVYSLSHAEL